MSGGREIANNECCAEVAKWNFSQALHNNIATREAPLGNRFVSTIKQC